MRHRRGESNYRIITVGYEFSIAIFFLPEKSKWWMKHEVIVMIKAKRRNDISFVLDDGKYYASFTRDYDRLPYNSGRSIHTLRLCQKK